MQQIDRGIYIENTYPGVTIGAVLLPMGTILIDAPLRGGRCTSLAERAL